MKIRFNTGLDESFKKGFPMKENDNYEDDTYIDGHDNFPDVSKEIGEAIKEFLLNNYPEQWHLRNVLNRLDAWDLSGMDIDVENWVEEELESRGITNVDSDISYDFKDFLDEYLTDRLDPTIGKKAHAFAEKKFPGEDDKTYDYAYNYAFYDERYDDTFDLYSSLIDCRLTDEQINKLNDEFFSNLTESRKSYKKGFPMKESDNYEDELDDIDAEMDDKKELARQRWERRKNDYRSDRDYRAKHDVGKRFKDLDSIDAEMDDEKEFAKNRFARRKDDARADRDYWAGKRFPMKESYDGNMVLIMVDETGEEVEIDRFNLSGLLDEDEVEIWKDTKIDKARKKYPEAIDFYFEDRRDWGRQIRDMIRHDFG